LEIPVIKTGRAVDAQSKSVEKYQRINKTVPRRRPLHSLYISLVKWSWVLRIKLLSNLNEPSIIFMKEMLSTKWMAALHHVG